MKFSIALALLFAGLANSQQLQPKQTVVDAFLRETQHLKPTTQLVSINQHGPIATLTYQDGPLNLRYDVRTDGNNMKIVAIEKMLSFGGNFQFTPIASNQPQPNIQIQQLPPLPLIMPQFSIQNNGDVQMRNVFDRVEKQIIEMQQKMERNRLKFQQQMENKRIQMQQNFNKKFNDAIIQTPLIGGGDHDFNWATQIDIQPNQPLIGSGDHDIWEVKPVDFNAEHPIIGDDDHDDWQQKKKKCHKNLKNEELIGAGDHDWKGEKHGKMKHHGKGKRHHSNAAWLNQMFSKQSISKYLNEKLPDMMKECEVIEIIQKGHEKGKGFKLNIKLKDKQQNLHNILAYFKPMKEEFLIDKIQKIKPSILTTGKQIIYDVLKNILGSENSQEQKKGSVEETQNLVSPDFIPEEPKPLLLGGQTDPDHEIDFLKLPQEIEVHQDNHITDHKEEEVYQVALFKEQDKPDTQVPAVEQKPEVPLPGGKQDPDNKIETQEIVKEVLKLAEDILQEETVEDIDSAEDQVEKVDQAPKQQIKQVKQKLQLLTHRR